MAALTADSWTVTITRNAIGGRDRIIRGTLALAGVDTYTTGGIPLPVIGKLGLQRYLDKFTIISQDPAATTQYLPMYDKTNHKLGLYEEEAVAAGGPLLEADAAEVPGPRTYGFEAIGW